MPPRSTRPPSATTLSKRYPPNNWSIEETAQRANFFDKAHTVATDFMSQDPDLRDTMYASIEDMEGPGSNVTRRANPKSFGDDWEAVRLALQEYYDYLCTPATDMSEHMWHALSAFTAAVIFNEYYVLRTYQGAPSARRAYNIRLNELCVL